MVAQDKSMHAENLIRQSCTRENLEEVIHAARGRIAWTLHEKVGSGGFAVHSDPARREHVICWPRPGNFDPPRYLEYLHELVHARLAEEVHPLFSGPAFAPGSDRILVDTALPVFQAALDWFVEYEVVRLCPERKKPELAAQHEVVLRCLHGCGSLDPAGAACAALLTAKAVAWLGREPGLSGLLAELTQAFVRTPAHKPSLFTLRALTNRLLVPLFGMRAEMAMVQGRRAWLLRL